MPDFPVDDLREHPENPRRGNVELIAGSIAVNDFYGAVLVQAGTGRVVAGNHRLKAARSLGRDTVPAIVADLDDDQARRILLVDNRSNDLAGYDDDVLGALLSDLAASSDLTGTGYDDVDLGDILARLNPPSLDELADQYGHEARPEDGLIGVELRFTVAGRDLFTGMWGALGGDNDDERVQALAAHLDGRATA